MPPVLTIGLMHNHRALFLLFALLVVITLMPEPAAGREIPIEYSFNESHPQIYEQMLERNATLGEYYEQVCPEFLESMPPEVRAHVYNTTMSRSRDLAADREFVPPLVRGKIAVATASPVISVGGVRIDRLIGVGILTLLAVAGLVWQRLQNRKE